MDTDGVFGSVRQWGPLWVGKTPVDLTAVMATRDSLMMATLTLASFRSSVQVCFGSGYFRDVAGVLACDGPPDVGLLGGEVMRRHGLTPAPPA